jgi:3-methyladenine DNA glycosylase AlkD
MDQQTLNFIGQMPIVAILIYLLYKESAKTEKLLVELLEQSKQHANDLVQMAVAGFNRRGEEEAKKQ